MAPGTRRAANRGGYAEHDDFEGLPVRQWRQEWATIAPPEKQEHHDRNDIWAHELIHGMPKDANLLPPHTQELLRAARSGRLYNTPLPPEDEEVDSETVLPDKADKKDKNDEASKKFSIKTWKQVPKNVEATTTSYLATPRKGIVRIASKTVPDRVGGPTVTRATVKRLDAAGNSYTEEVTLADGQPVDGEIIATRVETAAPAVVNSAAAVPSPAIRRRPPPPKRKSKGGPGRGRKRHKLGSERPVGSTPADGSAPTPESFVKKEGESHQDSTNADDDNDNDNDNDNDDNDEDESDDGDEEEKGEAHESGDGQPQETAEDAEPQDKEMADAPTVDPSVLDNADIEMKDGETTPEKPTPPNPLTLAPPAASLASGSPKVEGSPLKNVLISSPTKETSIPAQPPLDAMPAIPKAPVEESVVAEPPSTIVGDEPDKAMDRDVEAPPPLEGSVSTDEALLPPPPEQVGNIASPKHSPRPSPKPENTQEQPADEADRASPAKEEDPQSEPTAVPEKPILPHLAESNMTEDSIKPDDSASVGRPATASGPSSDAAGPTAGEAPLAEGRAPSTEAVADAIAPPPSPPAVGVESFRQPEADSLQKEESEEPHREAVTKEPEVKPEESTTELAPEPEITAEADPAPPATDAPVAESDAPDLLGGLMGRLGEESTKPAVETEAAAPDNPTEASEEPKRDVEEVKTG